LLLVHLMMIKLAFADSIVGPAVTRTRSASLAGGSILVSGTGGEAKELEHHKLPPRVMIANDGRILVTCKPLMPIPHEELPTTVHRKARTGRMETFHAPCRLDYSTLVKSILPQSILQRLISAAGMIDALP
jgi:hypothetical protein